jgi:hypothetical protein
VKSRAEAEAIREEVMKERSIMIESVNTEFFARVRRLSSNRPGDI